MEPWCNRNATAMDQFAIMQHNRAGTALEPHLRWNDETIKSTPNQIKPQPNHYEIAKSDAHE